MRLFAALPVLLVAAALGAPAPAAADEWRYDVYNELMSPYCPGRSLADCPSSQAAQLREWIGAQEEAGRSRQDVEEQLYRLYGDAVLSAPRARGWGLTAYLIPVAGFAAGGLLLWAFLRRQGEGGSTSRPAPAAPAPVDADLERRIDEELRGGTR